MVPGEIGHRTFSFGIQIGRGIGGGGTRTSIAGMQTMVCNSCSSGQLHGDRVSVIHPSPLSEKWLLNNQNA